MALSQEDLVLQQFSAARQKLGQQQKAQQDQAEQDLNRRTAMSAMTGGAATKALEKTQRGIAEGFGSASADLEAQQAKALQDVQAGREAQQYQTSERLGTQQFAAGESEKSRNEAQRQFNANYGLQNAQFQAAQNQFNKQMDFTYREFNENQKANLLNSLIALDQSGIDSSADLNKIASFFANIMNPTNLKAGSMNYNAGIGDNIVRAPSIGEVGPSGQTQSYTGPYGIL